MITRFAPSPTGPLHLGHAYSAILGFDMARARGGDWLLRIEDIDRQRSKPEWEAAIYEDLEWLGLWWPEPVMRQSERLQDYDQALDELWNEDFLFECLCTRADVLASLAAPQEDAPPTGPDGIIYPGTCRANRAGFPPRPRKHLQASLRLNMTMLRRLDRSSFIERRPYSFQEIGYGPKGEHGWIEFTDEDMIRTVGDIVLARRDMGTSYHLSVVLDDAAQGVSHVTRGEDLFDATRIHVVLQRLLGLPTPTYHHHKLIRDENGKRLAKRDDARAISLYRSEGATPDDIRQMVGL